MTRSQAITAIDAKLRKTDSSVYQLKVIHGFHGGTVLRDAVRTHYRNHPKVKRMELGLNQGETTLILREL
jgi:DNA-nicking Smr family endonuclease